MSSTSSAHSRQHEGLPPGEPRSSNCLPVASPLDPHRDENIDTSSSSQAILTLKRWILARMKKSDKEPALHEPDRVPGKSHRAADLQSRSRSPAKLEDVGPSRMAANKRVPVSALP